jgi:hypothetical protein
MHQRRRALLDPIRLEMGILAVDRLAPERRSAGCLLAEPGPGLDLPDHSPDSISIDRCVERLPTRQRNEGELLALYEGLRVVRQALAAGAGCERSVVP